MPGRLSARGIFFALSVVAMGAIINAILHDHAVQLGVSGLSGNEAQAVDAIPDIEPSTVTLAAVFDPQSVHLPAGFSPQWQTLHLDNQVDLQALERKFTLTQTENGSGSEYFDYAAAMFEQMAEEVREPDLSRRMHALGKRAQHMGYQVREAAALRFEGTPNNDMAHLRVHAGILSHLDALNRNALVKQDYDEHGQPLPGLQQGMPAPGKSLQAFRQEVQAILNHPDSARYPQTMALLRQEAGLLEKLAMHLDMRWESTLDCTGGPQCDGRAMYVRLYTRQTLPEEEIALSPSLD